MFVVFWQYIPSVEDTVLGIVVDTKPDVSIHLHSELPISSASYMIAFILSTCNSDHMLTVQIYYLKSKWTFANLTNVLWILEHLIWCSYSFLLSWSSLFQNFLVDIKGPNLAFLPVLAFEGGTRRNIPKFEVWHWVINYCWICFIQSNIIFFMNHTVMSCFYWPSKMEPFLHCAYSPYFFVSHWTYGFSDSII